MYHVIVVGARDTVSVEEFFAPGNIQRITGAASTPA